MCGVRGLISAPKSVAPELAHKSKMAGRPDARVVGPLEPRKDKFLRLLPLSSRDRYGIGVAVEDCRIFVGERLGIRARQAELDLENGQPRGDCQMELPLLPEYGFFRDRSR